MINTDSLEVLGDPISVGNSPLGVAFAPGGGRACVASWGVGTVSAIDTASLAVVGEPTAVGDGQMALDAGPTPTHTYSGPGAYDGTVTLTDSEGCSTSFVFTGLTASCNGSPSASATSTFQVTPPPSAEPGPPHGEPTPPPAKPPSNAFRIGKPQRDERRGIAKLKIRVPGAGTLLLRGKRVRTVKRTIGRARTLTLVVRPKRNQLNALKRPRASEGAGEDQLPSGRGRRPLARQGTDAGP